MEYAYVIDDEITLNKEFDVLKDLFQKGLNDIKNIDYWVRKNEKGKYILVELSKIEEPTQKEQNTKRYKVYFKENNCTFKLVDYEEIKDDNE